MNLSIDQIVADLLASVQPEYPASHVAGMRVPKGGSSCESCKFLADNKTDCKNKFFQKWHGSAKIPDPIDEYCSDWYEPREDIQAYGTSEGAVKGWENRIRHAHGISVDIFNRYNKPNPNAISVRTFLEHDPPSLPTREKLAKAFLKAQKVATDDVAIDTLTPLQNTVFKDKVEGIARVGMHRNPIDVFRYKEKTYVIDGHHRLAVVALDGHDTIPANIYEIPKEEINAGGPGSGCNPEVGKCGRPAEADPHELAENFLHAVQHWQEGSHYIRHAALAIMTGKQDNVNYDADAEKDALSLLDGIRNGDEFNRNLYRGVSIMDKNDPVLQLKPGDEFQLPMQSFSTNLGVAHGFAIGAKEGDTHVVFQIEGHSKGLDVGKAVGDYSFKENEVITNGKFKVENVSDERGYGPGMFHVIHVSQQGLL